MYGSTEGTVGLINRVNKVGAVGYLPQIFSSILPRFLPITVIKLDENGISKNQNFPWKKSRYIFHYLIGEPLRDPKTGLCIHCKPDEEGEIIGLVRPDDRGGPEKFQVISISSKFQLSKNVKLWSKLHLRMM